MAIMDLYLGDKRIFTELNGKISKTDLGYGVALTDKVSVARERACRAAQDGYVTRYALETRGLKILDLCERKRGILPWLSVLFANRSFRLDTNRAKDTIQAIKEEYSINTEGYDVVIGYIADGSAFTAARAYLEGKISLEALTSAVAYRGCPKQVVLLTDAAISAATFSAYASVRAISYYPRSISRDAELRRATIGTDSYKEELTRHLAEAFDYAVNVAEIKLARFTEMLTCSGIIDALDKKDPYAVSGRSGSELAMDAIGAVGILKDGCELHRSAPNNDEYRLGELVASYSLERGVSLRFLFNTVGVDALYSLSSVSFAEFCSSVNALILEKCVTARLQEQRKLRGMSQRELAEASGVNLRTLQQYELKTKDINKASAFSVLSLARVLGCRADDILEPEA